MCILLAAGCSKYASVSSPDLIETSTAGSFTPVSIQAAATQTAVMAVTLTYVATAGSTVQAAATQTAVIKQTLTEVAAEQQAANAQSTATAIAVALHGTSTPTINTTATAQEAIAVATATANVAVTLTYVLTAGSTAQTAATQTQTAVIAIETATVAAQQTAKAGATVIVISPSYTDTPYPSYTPTLTATPTPFGTPPALPINIQAYIYYDDFSTPSTSCDLFIYDNNSMNITNAVVTVKNLSQGTRINFSDGYSNLDNFFVAGNTLEVDVYFYGTTYTASAVVPGNAQLSPDGNTVSWQYTGNSGSIYISDPRNNNIYNTSISGNTADISSFYPEAGIYGDYYVGFDMSTVSSFSGGAMVNSSFNVGYYSGWDVNAILDSRFPDSTPTPAPAPSALSIGASIIAYDLEGGVSVLDGVYVSDINGNPITDAGVTIKNLTDATSVKALYTYDPNYGQGYFVTNGTNYAPGDSYEIDICVSGVTYTARAYAPAGSGSLSADCDTVSWQSNGNYMEIYTDGPDNIHQTNLPGSSYDISPLYTSAGTYSIYLTLGNIYGNSTTANFIYAPGIFTGASLNSYIAVGYQYGWDVNVTF